MDILITVLIYTLEAAISAFYFGQRFDQKRPTNILFLCYTLSAGIQMIIHSIDIIANSFIFNVISFMVCNIIIAYVCYNTKLLQAVFNVFLLEVIMITTELILVYMLSAFLNIQIEEGLKSTVFLFVITVSTKGLYFVVVYLISGIKSHKTVKTDKNDFSMSLFLMPLISIAILLLFGQILSKVEADKSTYYLFTITTVLLLFINIIVFFINRKVVNTLHENMEYHLEKQKAEINTEYYRELEQQFNSSAILVHDIKRQLSTIYDLAEQKEYENVKEYISSINDGYNIPFIKRYTDNKLLNVIVSRYTRLFHDCDISWDIDIRNVDLSFVSDSDLTALVDNLLENALDAAKKSEKKNVQFLINNKNSNYIFITVKNSCDAPPKKIGKNYVSEKEGRAIHGYGLKSIKSVVKKYEGEIELDYLEESKEFQAIVMLKNKKN